jgi:hypothetical protein
LKIEFESAARVNFVIWITSLTPDQEGVTRRILEDVEPYFAGIGLEFEKYAPETASSLLNILDAVAASARKGFCKPIIHFDLHGSEAQGLYIAASREFIPWPDIIEKLRAINIGTRNNLCVVSGACFSWRLAKSVDLMKATPFYVLMAPQKETCAGFLEKTMFLFCKDIFDKGDLLGSHNEHLSSKMEVFHCERLMLIVLLRYFKFACMGKAKRERMERLLTETIDTYGRRDLLKIQRHLQARNKALRKGFQGASRDISIREGSHLYL